MEAGKQLVRGMKVIVGLPDGDKIEGVVRDAVDIERSADVEYVRDEDNNDAAAIVSNRGVRKTIAGNMRRDVDIAKGDVVEIGGGKYIVDSASISRSRSLARFTVTVYAPDGFDFDSVSHGEGEADPAPDPDPDPDPDPAP